jgi:hypothetical protein
MDTTRELLQERIRTMPMLGGDREQVMQAFLAAEAILDAAFSVAGWLGRGFARKTPRALTPTH